MEKRITESGKSYWNDNGAYQEEYDKLYKELVPSSGEADTVHGEMIRVVSRLFYDYCNNGNCNVLDGEMVYCPDCDGSGSVDDHCYNCDGNGFVEVWEDDMKHDEDCIYCDGSGYECEECSYCGGDGRVPGDAFIKDYYFDMIKFLKRHLNNTDVVENLVEFLKRDDLGYGSYTFSSNEMKVYNDLVDEVMHQVLTTENQKRIAIS